MRQEVRITKEENRMILNFEELFQAIRSRPKRVLAVPAAEGESIVEACAEARREGICDSVLVGGQSKIFSIMDKMGVARDTLPVLDEPDSDRAVRVAIGLVRDGKASMLMKGKTDTPTLLKAVLDAETGLRTGRVLTHVAVVEVPAYPKLILTTDGGILISPDLDKRMDSVRNAVEVAHRLGVDRPCVALLSAMEKVNPKMQETLDYEKIVSIQRERPFVEAVVEGPLAMDIALSRESAKIKGVESEVAGKADVFVTPDISSCNIYVKALIYLAGAKVGGLVVGAAAPIVLLSRSDDAATKLRSIALGALWGRS